MFWVLNGYVLYLYGDCLRVARARNRRRLRRGRFAFDFYGEVVGGVNGGVYFYVDIFWVFL